MNRGDWLAVILLFLIPIPFIATSCLVSFSAKFMGISDEKAIQDFKRALTQFRVRQIESLFLIAILFIVSLAIAYWIGKVKLPYYAIFSTMVLTQAAFGQLGWEIQTWDGGSVMEIVNKWWFRVLYSVGVILLFVAILSGK